MRLTPTFLFELFEAFWNNFQVVVFPDNVFPINITEWRNRRVSSNSKTFLIVVSFRSRLFSSISRSMASIILIDEENLSFDHSAREEKTTSEWSFCVTETPGKISSTSLRNSGKSLAVIFGKFMSNIAMRRIWNQENPWKTKKIENRRFRLVRRSFRCCFDAFLRRIEEQTEKFKQTHVSISNENFLFHR